MIDIENPPEIVADIFASLIKNYNFETVEFAVFCRNDTKNYDVFEPRFVKLRYNYFIARKEFNYVYIKRRRSYHR